MPLVQTRGAASAQGFGEFAQAAAPANYIEDVFSTFLYTGNGTTQTINNGIDLAGKGGLVWAKSRSNATQHALFDTVRSSAGNGRYLSTNNTDPQAAAFDTDFGGFNSNGFSYSGSTYYGALNLSGFTYCSWTFREQPKFFDVVTYTGDGSSLKTIAHNLGSVPGMIIVKSTTTATWNWTVYHRSLGITQKIYLNTTDAAIAENGNFGGTAPTSTDFSVGYSSTNQSGQTYVAYLFAHDAGGFGAAGTDNVISCGSFTTDGSGNATINLGYEPQYMLLKSSSTDDGYGWLLFDNMRGWNETKDFCLKANSSNAEFDAFALGSPTATGFYTKSLQGSSTYIYMAIRRPMKPPTSGTEVFSPVLSPLGGNQTVNANFPIDLLWHKSYEGVTDWYSVDRLRGNNLNIFPNTTSAEANFADSAVFNKNGSQNTMFVNLVYYPKVSYLLRRASGFFDVVCYTGTGSATTFNHNLGVVPELMIVKGRNVAGAWRTYVSSLGNTNHLVLNTDGQVNGGDMWNSTTPTSTVFSIGTSGSVNTSGGTYVAYLFASCPGVSKVGSYTGNGTTQTINCGFTSGARFVLIKRTDLAGDWYVYDTARGMTTLTDPYLLLNSTAVESATLGSVTTSSTGFDVNAAILAAINTSGASYIFLAIA